MRDCFRNHKEEFIFFCIAVALRLLIAFALAWSPLSQHANYPLVGSDSRGYLELAESFVERGDFSNADPQLSQFRTPGYPLFIASLLYVFGHILAVSIIQSVLAGAAAVLLYRFAVRSCSRFAARISALFFVIDPLGIYFTGTILSETVFLFLLLLATYTLVFHTNKYGTGIAGALLGLSVLVRPSALLLFPVFLLWRALIGAQKNMRAIVVPLLLFTLTFFVMVAPHMIGNKIHYNSWSIATVGDATLYRHPAHLFYAYKHAISMKETEAILHQRLMEINPHKDDSYTFQNVPYFRQLTKEIIMSDPLGYAKFHIIKTLPFFISDGLRELAYRLHIIGPLPNIGDTYLTKGLWETAKIILTDVRSAFLFLAGFLFWLCINILMLGSAVAATCLKVIPRLRSGYFRSHGENNPYWHIPLFCLFIVLIVGFSTGPVANPRYRYSVSPFMFLAASYGLWYIKERISQRTTHENQQ